MPWSAPPSRTRGWIKKIVTDANDNPTKQVADIQDLVQRGVDILIVRPATEAVDAAVNRAAKAGIPVILGDRRTPSDDYVSYLTVDDWAQGRNMAPHGGTPHALCCSLPRQA